MSTDHGMRVEFPASQSGKLPGEGPLLLVAGRLKGTQQHGALLQALRTARPDVKIFQGRLTGAALAEAEEKLHESGAVLVISATDLARGRSQSSLDEAASLARLALVGKASVQALKVRGSKRQRWFRTAFGAAMPSLMPSLSIQAGAPLPLSRLLLCNSEREAGELLKLWQWLLSKRSRTLKAPAATPSRLRGWRGKPLASALPVALLEKEIQALAPSARLASSGDLECYVAEAAAIPNLLREIGRLREESFRAVGEGSGLPLDLDRFDQHYLQLFIWHRAQRCVVGGYRFTPTDKTLERFGPAGLYSHSLMRYKPELLRHLDPAIELGRSFVAQPFQRDYAPLLLLWKGIGAWVAAHPRYVRLFGLVSMSAAYQPLSRELTASFIKQNLYRPELAAWTRPRMPYAPAYRPGRLDALTWRYGQDLDQVSGWISELEPDRKGLPVLFRQYAKLGAYFFGFNVDPAFGHALDALVCVDLRNTEPRLLGRTMGAEAACTFLDFHSVTAGRA